MVLKRTVKIYFFIIALIFFNLTLFGFINFGMVANYIFPQGDHNFYIVNIGNGRIERKILTIEERFLTGSTYFIIDQDQYLGYIEATETNLGIYFSSFKFVDLKNPSISFTVKLPILQTENSGSILLDGLTVHYQEDQPIFSTSIQNGTSESNLKTNILQFSLNGTLISRINYSVPNYPYAKIDDLQYISYNKYLVLTKLKESEILDLGATHILTFDFQGNVSDIIDLDKKARSITFDPNTNFIFTSTRDSVFIDQRNSKGELIKSIKVNIEASEIDLINSTHLIIRESQQNIINFLYASGFTITVIFIVPILLQYSNKIHSFIKNLGKDQ